MKISDLFKNEKSEDSKKSSSSSFDSWEKDSYKRALTQRNFALLLLLISFSVIFMSLFAIRYLKSTQTIEPFVIEIEKKTGVPTVVEPLSVETYSADESIKRYFLVKYIKAREGYDSSTFNRNYYDVIRLLSTSSVYYDEYRPRFSQNNPSSPYSKYGSSSTVDVGIKSIIFLSPTSVQVRVALKVSGQVNIVMDKIIFMEFRFANLSMNDEDRLINPLGFQVTLYKIDNENI